MNPATMRSANHAVRAGLICLLLVSLPAAYGKREDPVSQSGQQDVMAGLPAPSIEETQRIAQQAYIYGFPMIAAYKAMYQFNVDRASPQFKAGFNQVWNDAKTFTPEDTAIPTPNADTPYSMIQADLRAEPLVFCVPEVEKGRYFSAQLADLYSFNYGYVGSRTTGNGAGCYLVAGPNWKGDKPKGISKVFRSETQFSLIIFRAQLFNAADIDNVKKVQAGFRAEPLSSFLKQPAPPAAPSIDFPPFLGQDPFTSDFATTLHFLLQFAPVVPEEAELRAKFASIGIGPGKSFHFKDLSPEHKAAVALAIKQGGEAIEKRRNQIGKNINGWIVGAAFGDRAFFKGDYELRAAAALAGIYGNDAAEAMYPFAKTDSSGDALDGSKHRYTLTFAKDQLPPVNSFWSVTMYDGKTQLLINNPINRYLINSPMLPQLKKNADGSLTLYIQMDSPGEGKEANWLPAPDGPIYMVMRLYWPKDTPPSILPPGEGSWKPPAVIKAQ
jgi:hypothetical protein